MEGSRVGGGGLPAVLGWGGDLRSGVYQRWWWWQLQGVQSRAAAAATGENLQNLQNLQVFDLPLGELLCSDSQLLLLLLLTGCCLVDWLVHLIRLGG